MRLKILGRTGRNSIGRAPLRRCGGIFPLLPLPRCLHVMSPFPLPPRVGNYCRGAAQRSAHAHTGVLPRCSTGERNQILAAAPGDLYNKDCNGGGGFLSWPPNSISSSHCVLPVVSVVTRPSVESFRLSGCASGGSFFDRLLGRAVNNNDDGNMTMLIKIAQVSS